MRTTLNDFAYERMWVAWREERSRPEDQFTKRPYRAVGRLASVIDQNTWLTRPQARRVADELRRLRRQDDDLVGRIGVGIVFDYINDDWYLAGVDLDTCLDAKGNIELWAQEIIDRLHTYTEVSPSGTGVKCFFQQHHRLAFSVWSRICRHAGWSDGRRGRLAATRGRGAD